MSTDPQLALGDAPADDCARFDPQTTSPTLALARRMRAGRVEADPFTLHRAAGREMGFADDGRLASGGVVLYQHAMVEAGAIVLRATGRPENPCRICGHRFPGEDPSP